MRIGKVILGLTNNASGVRCSYQKGTYDMLYVIWTNLSVLRWYFPSCHPFFALYLRSHKMLKVKTCTLR